MPRTKKSPAQRPVNDGSLWSEQDDKTLLDLMERDVPKAAMSTILGRTLRSVDQRLNTFHREAWRTSGHHESGPVSQPRGPQRPDPGALERHRTLEAKVDRLTVMVETLLREMCGPEQVHPEEGRANGRAHP